MSRSAHPGAPGGTVAVPNHMHYTSPTSRVPATIQMPNQVFNHLTDQIEPVTVRIENQAYNHYTGRLEPVTVQIHNEAYNHRTGRFEPYSSSHPTNHSSPILRNGGSTPPHTIYPPVYQGDSTMQGNPQHAGESSWPRLLPSRYYTMGFLGGPREPVGGSLLSRNQSSWLAGHDEPHYPTPPRGRPGGSDDGPVSGVYNSVAGVNPEQTSARWLY